MLAKKPILVMLELYPGDGLGKVICEPWQNLWMEGEFVGRTPMEVPNLGGGPVAFSLRLAKVHEPIHVRLSARPLEGKHQ